MKKVEANPRREVVLVFAVALVGAVLRFWSFSQIGLTHFDEGVYALAGLWVESPLGITATSSSVWLTNMFPFAAA